MSLFKVALPPPFSVWLVRLRYFFVLVLLSASLQQLSQFSQHSLLLILISSVGNLRTVTTFLSLFMVSVVPDEECQHRQLCFEITKKEQSQQSNLNSLGIASLIHSYIRQDSHSSMDHALPRSASGTARF
mmetsp:Transcript_11163/g.21591  ORF Transcript_11163/g.21591 Transcript_11163/m.21591 type:complete len:130 (-) Transcript_11163:2264-2653(-)